MTRADARRAAGRVRCEECRDTRETHAPHCMKWQAWDVADSCTCEGAPCDACAVKPTPDPALAGLRVALRLARRCAHDAMGDVQPDSSSEERALALGVRAGAWRVVDAIARAIAARKRAIARRTRGRA